MYIFTIGKILRSASLHEEDPDMRKGMFDDREIRLAGIVEREYGLFRYRMLSKSRKKIFRNSNEINFYRCVHEYLMCADDISREHIGACLRYEEPIAELYRVYQRYEYLRYGRWEEIEELLDVLVREQEEHDRQENPTA